MRLRQLLRDIPEVSYGGLPDIEITALTADSRQVTPGVLFVAIRGETAGEGEIAVGLHGCRRKFLRRCAAENSEFRKQESELARKESYWAQRNAPLVLLGLPPLRHAQRTCLGSLYHEPPRRHRQSSPSMPSSTRCA